MQIDLTVANQDTAGRNYLTWAPVMATARLLSAKRADPVTVTISNENPQAGGQVEFAAARDRARTPTIDLDLPADGSPVEFWVAGVVGKPSSADGDAVLRVAEAGAAEALTSKPLMVRVRKNADQLSSAERDRFTTALAMLNNQGTGLFRNFRAMHQQEVALAQAHGAAGFLAWHRAYLLDLERELQKCDPSVTLPYWRFDQPAPSLFTADFLGQSGPRGSVSFSGTNLLRHWQTDNAAGITRSPGFDVLTGQANVFSQARTLVLGGVRPDAIFDTGPLQGGFDEMAFNPHGNAHVSFRSSYISSAATAPRDPLFFLLHCNVDRLWALWQWLNDRFDGTQEKTFFFRGSVNSTPSTDIGHNLLDTMWPWNNVTGFPRPDDAPRTPFPAVPTANAPSPAPTVGDMIDYQGFLDPGSDMNFAYDDVPFGVAPVP